MNDFIKGYPSSPPSSSGMFDGAAVLLNARFTHDAVQHALLTRARLDSVARAFQGTTDGAP